MNVECVIAAFYLAAIIFLDNRRGHYVRYHKITYEMSKSRKPERKRAAKLRLASLLLFLGEQIPIDIMWRLFHPAIFY